MKKGRIALVIVLLVVGLIAVNYLASSLPFRIDATAGHIYTLSPGSKAILAKLEEPVRLDLYYSSDASGIRVSQKNYAARVEEMLRQYVRAGHGMIKLNVIDPKPDTPEEDKATAAGVRGQPLPDGDNFYFGLDQRAGDLALRAGGQAGSDPVPEFPARAVPRIRHHPRHLHGTALRQEETRSPYDAPSEGRSGLPVDADGPHAAGPARCQRVGA